MRRIILISCALFSLAGGSLFLLLFSPPHRISSAAPAPSSPPPVSPESASSLPAPAAPPKREFRSKTQWIARHPERFFLPESIGLGALSVPEFLLPGERELYTAGETFLKFFIRKKLPSRLFLKSRFQDNKIILKHFISLGLLPRDYRIGSIRLEGRDADVFIQLRDKAGRRVNGTIFFSRETGRKPWLIRSVDFDLYQFQKSQFQKPAEAPSPFYPGLSPGSTGSGLSY